MLSPDSHCPVICDWGEFLHGPVLLQPQKQIQILIVT